MNKEDFRLNNKHLAELRNELRSQPVLKTRHLLLPVTTALAALMWFLLLPNVQQVPLQQAKKVEAGRVTYEGRHPSERVMTYMDLVIFEKAFEKSLERKKLRSSKEEKFQRWKKKMPYTLADRMAKTRQRLQKLKVKINS